MEQKLIKINHITIGFCWFSLLIAILTTLLSVGNIWMHIGLFLIVPFRYLVFKIYPQEKEISFQKEIDRLMPFSTLSSFISRPSNSKQQKFLNYLGGIFWFIVTLMFNGYYLLWLDTIKFHEGEASKTKEDDVFDKIGAHYHLYKFQVDKLRALSLSEDKDDKRMLKEQLKKLTQAEIEKTLHPLGIPITTNKMKRQKEDI